MRLSKIYPWPTTFNFSPALPFSFFIERHRPLARDIYKNPSLLISDLTVNFYFRHNLYREYREIRSRIRDIPTSVSF